MTLVNEIRNFLKIPRFLEFLVFSVLRSEYRNLLQSERYADTQNLIRFGGSSYSQGDEDGIICEIFRRIGTTDKYFVEIGCGDGIENNTHALVLSGWHGLWIDGSEALINRALKTFADLVVSRQLSIVRALVDPDNVNSIVEAHSTGEIDLLSLDIDGNDFHVLGALTCIDPRVVVLEYNARKGPVIDWVMKYNDNQMWNGSDYFGASLKSFEILMKSKGYCLVGCSITGVNAFFVRNDLVGEMFQEPFTSEQHFETQKKYLRLGIHTAHDRSYGEWIKADDYLKKRES